MNAAPPSLMAEDPRVLRRELAAANDAQVMDALQYIDQLPDRDAANALLARLRPRLRNLRLARPLRLERLLYMPLNPALVDARVWRAGSPQIPRSMLPPLSAMLRAAAPDLVQAAELIIADQSVAEPMRAYHAGSLLWPTIGELVATARLPAEWHQTALPPACYAPLAAACAPVLRAALHLQEIADPSIPLSELNQALAALLAQQERHGPGPWGVMLTVLIRGFPHADAALRAATAMRVDRAMRQAGDACIESLWSWLEPGREALGLRDLAEAAGDLRGRGLLLAQLARDTQLRRRAATAQADLHTAGARDLAREVEAHLLAPLRALTADQPAPDLIVTALEYAARAMRRIDIELRRLRLGTAPETLLLQAADEVRANPALPAIDRDRLVDILLGRHAASLAWPAT